MSDNRPIAILDTGAGGLSVVTALRNIAPHEQIHYFADYAHLPYGLKSPKLIQKLALKAVQNFLELSDYKILVIACHTISVWHLKEIQQSLSIPVIGMFEPSVMGLKNYLLQNDIKTLGIISTKATLDSGAYHNFWPAIDPHRKTTLVEQACSSLVSLIEENNLAKPQLQIIIEQLLHDKIKNADGVMLGCTHFKALVPVLKNVLKENCHIIDAAQFVATQVHQNLKASNQLTDITRSEPIKVVVSDNPQRFLNVAQSFMSETPEVEELMIAQE
ncbi:MAG: glutamate racemase [Myxococcales bacterium]|nr:glutamate racemase [Myxococcales bacterium]USN49953.1 MAG: glutamate racemase [Myxococcales bacterium]